MRSATQAWLLQVSKIRSDGVECGDTLELLSSSLHFDMSVPVVGNVSRKTNYGFMFGEALYIISGQSNVEQLEQHIKKFGDYADLYPFQQGSYGPPFVEQIRYVVDSLNEHPNSRQAVMTIWRPNPRKSKDIPCTIGLQFLVRYGKLHTIVTMRSSDAFTGLIYDMFCFTAMTAVVRSFLWEKVQLGTCWINAGSSHLYNKDKERYEAIDFSDMSAKPFPFEDDYLSILDQLQHQIKLEKK